MKPVFFGKSCAVSPQNSLEDPLLMPVISPFNGKLQALEPDYHKYIPVMQARRMNRMLKMALYAAIDCLSTSESSLPEGIITGTSRGNLSGTERFLKDLIQFREEGLNPTPFIFSTYNMLNGAIALQTGINGYNQTFVHQGSSFELALFDAQMYFNERKGQGKLLVGCYDELTDDYFVIKNKPAWQQGQGINFSGSEAHKRETEIPAGEGAAFFLIGNSPQDAIASLYKIHMFEPRAAADLPQVLKGELETLGWSLPEIDLLVLGHNDDPKADPFYHALLSIFPRELPVLSFKFLCGEHECAGGFGIWLLLQYLKGKPLPEDIWYTPVPRSKPIGKILYYNHFRGVNHNFLLLERIKNP